MNSLALYHSLKVIGAVAWLESINEKSPDVIGTCVRHYEMNCRMEGRFW